MRMDIKKPRRDRHNIHTDIIAALGGVDAVARRWLVKPITVRKCTEDPNGSGQDITFAHFQDFLAAAGENLTNLPLQNAIDELLADHVLNLCYRRAYLEEKVFQFIEMLSGQKATTKTVVNE